jgi:hypothetical protein
MSMAGSSQASGATKCTVLVAVLLGLSPSTLCGQLKHGDLQKIAREALRSKEVLVEEPSFSVRGGQLFYELGRGRAVLDPSFEHYSPMNAAIDAQLQVEILRQSRSNDRQKKYWEPILARVEKIIADKLPGLQDDKLSEREHNDLAAALSRQVEEVYEEAMAAYAREQGLEVGIAARYAPPHTVKLVTSPPGGRIFLSHAIQVRVAQLQGKEPDWRLIDNPNSLELEGKYFYLVQWGSKTVQGKQPIQVDRSGTFVLR